MVFRQSGCKRNPDLPNRRHQPGTRALGLLGLGAVAIIVLLVSFRIKEPEFAGESIRFWETELLHPDPRRQERALQAIRTMGQPALVFLAADLCHEDSKGISLLRWMDQQMGGLPWPLETAVERQARALQVLTRLGEKSTLVTAEVVGALTRPECRLNVVLFQPLLVRQGAGAIPWLLPVVRQTPRDDLAASILLVTRMIVEAGEVPQGLSAEILQDARESLDRDGPVMIEAIRLIGALGETGTPAMDDLAILVETGAQSPAMVAATVADALGRIGLRADRAVPVLTPLLRHPAVSVRIAAARALGQYGAAAASAGSELGQALLRFDSAFPVVAETLGRIGPAVRDQAPSLVRGLEHPDGFCRDLVVHALVKVSPDSEIAVPALIRCLNDPSRFVQRSAVEALGVYGLRAASAVPGLIELLADPEESVQIAVIQTLGAIGSSAKAAIPHLERAVATRQAGLRRYVIPALAQIQSDE